MYSYRNKLNKTAESQPYPVDLRARCKGGKVIALYKIVSFEQGGIAKYAIFINTSFILVFGSRRFEKTDTV